MGKCFIERIRQTVTVNELKYYGYNVCYKIAENTSRVDIATAVTNDLLAIPQKAILK